MQMAATGLIFSFSSLQDSLIIPSSLLRHRSSLCPLARCRHQPAVAFLPPSRRSRPVLLLYPLSIPPRLLTQGAYRLIPRRRRPAPINGHVHPPSPHSPHSPPAATQYLFQPDRAATGSTTGSTYVSLPTLTSSSTISISKKTKAPQPQYLSLRNPPRRSLGDSSRRPSRQRSLDCSTSRVP